MMNTNETGRSMVEMLGVLAIIGVLSVGGIAGYSMAMDRYRANEIMNTATMLAIAAQSANGGNGKADMLLSDAALDTPKCVKGMKADGTKATPEVTIEYDSTGCDKVKSAVAAMVNTSLYKVTEGTVSASAS